MEEISLVTPILELCHHHAYACPKHYDATRYKATPFLFMKFLWLLVISESPLNRLWWDLTAFRVLTAWTVMFVIILISQYPALLMCSHTYQHSGSKKNNNLSDMTTNEFSPPAGQSLFNTLRLRQNGYQFSDKIFEFIFLYENLCIFSQIALNFFQKGLTDNKPALVQMMAWCQTGDKPLSEPMMVQFTDANVCHSNSVESTHWGRDKMAAVSQTTLSNAFSWMKMLEFRLRFHWNLFLRVQLTIFQHWFR